MRVEGRFLLLPLRARHHGMPAATPSQRCCDSFAGRKAGRVPKFPIEIRREVLIKLVRFRAHQHFPLAQPVFPADRIFQPGSNPGCGVIPGPVPVLNGRRELDEAICTRCMAEQDTQSRRFHARPVVLPVSIDAVTLCTYTVYSICSYSIIFDCCVTPDEPQWLLRTNILDIK
jgi:hypothetical protein